MRNFYDPTASVAMGAVERDFKSKQKEAAKIAKQYLDEKISPAQLTQKRKNFNGRFRNLISLAIKKEFEIRLAQEKRNKSEPS